MSTADADAARVSRFLLLFDSSERVDVSPMSAGSLQSRNRGTSIPTCSKAISRDTYVPSSPYAEPLFFLLSHYSFFVESLYVNCP